VVSLSLFRQSYTKELHSSAVFRGSHNWPDVLTANKKSADQQDIEQQTLQQLTCSKDVNA
jgi:hypothetical protein